MTGYRPPRPHHHKKSLGQNFLHDQALLTALLDQCGLQPSDRVLEIGPGRGDMTQRMLQRVSQVTSIEIDRTLAPYLETLSADYPGFQLVWADALKTDIDTLMADHAPYHVVANIPYYLTTPLLEKLLTLDQPPRSINVMLQKEAAERLWATPKDEVYGPLTLARELRYQVGDRRAVPRHLFTPPPRVDSVFVSLTRLDAPALALTDEVAFLRLVRAGFAHRRKTLVNNLVSAYGLTRPETENLLILLGWSPTVRGEALTLSDYGQLFQALHSHGTL